MESRAFIHEDGQAGTVGVSGLVPWWSFTKTALAIALLRLAEQDRIRLDDPVEGERYTPVQLLRHEAGLSDYGSLQSYHGDVAAGRSPWSADHLLEAAEAGRLLFEPGQGWAYSNIGYLKIAQLIERASGLRLANALAELVFLPAGLPTARLAIKPDDLSGVHMGDVAGYHPGWVYHGLIAGTVVDAARLLHALFRGVLVKPETLARMLDLRSLPQFRSELHANPAYGLGMMMSATDTLEHPIGHSGSGPGSSIAVYFRKGSTAAVWASTASSVDTEAEVFRSLQTGGDDVLGTIADR